VNVPIGTVVYRTAAPKPRVEDEDGLLVEDDPEPVSDEVADSGIDSEAPEDGGHRPPLQDQPAFEDQIADLAEEGQEFVLCAGGKGGKGNVHFKSARNRAPIQYTDGEPGEQGHFLLELHTIADAALVGYPNAGKSTLLGKISAAHPKVAAYPFTTLRPSVGVVELDEYRRVTVADIPGLIEGAHRNVGLGHDFLRHITRCRVLLFVLDTAGSEGRHPIEDLQSLRREIDLYDSRLSQRPWCIIANKMDLPESDENLQAIRTRFPAVPVVPVSADRAEGIAELKEHLAKWVIDTAPRNTATSVETSAMATAE
jgi:GTP-binding protein